MVRTVGLLLAVAILGGVIGSGVTVIVRGGDTTTKRTAPEVVKALRASAGEWCPDKQIDKSADEVILYELNAPVEAPGGDWYTGCRVTNSAFGTIPAGIRSYCFRVKPDTLEVTRLPDPPYQTSQDQPSCETGWPQP